MFCPWLLNYVFIFCVRKYFLLVSVICEGFLTLIGRSKGVKGLAKLLGSSRYLIRFWWSPKYRSKCIIVLDIWFQRAGGLRHRPCPGNRRQRDFQIGCRGWRRWRGRGLQCRRSASERLKLNISGSGGGGGGSNGSVLDDSSTGLG